MPDFNTAIGAIDVYAGGVCYYVARIRHFNESQTPWTETDNYTDSSAESTNTPKYLGRYGIVRNNWYKLTVTGASNGIGEPIIPVPDVETPDDVKKYYIDCKIEILSWALRGQSIEF